MSKVYVSIEGNISSTKSTFLEYIRKHCRPNELEIVSEQIECWRNVRSFNLLDSALQGDKVAIANFQHYALFSVMEAALHGSLSGKSIYFSDRSLDTQERVFWRVLRQYDLMSPATQASLSDILQRMKDLGLWEPPQLVVYLRSDPEKCLQRCRARNRVEERNYTLDYLTDIHQAHETWISTLPNVHTIDIEDKTREELEQEAIGVLEHARLLASDSDDESVELEEEPTR